MNVAIWARDTVSAGPYWLAGSPLGPPLVMAYHARQSICASNVFPAVSVNPASGTWAGGHANFDVSRGGGVGVAAMAIPPDPNANAPATTPTVIHLVSRLTGLPFRPGARAAACGGATSNDGVSSSGGAVATDLQAEEADAGEAAGRDGGRAPHRRAVVATDRGELATDDDDRLAVVDRGEQRALLLLGHDHRLRCRGQPHGGGGLGRSGSGRGLGCGR